MSYLGVVTFEFDPAKSASNKIKHGLDFEEAQELWKGERLEAPSPVESTEPRFFVIGKSKVAITPLSSPIAARRCGSSISEPVAQKKYISMKTVKTSSRKMTAEELEARFDAGEDIGSLIDPSTIRRYGPGEERRDLTSTKVNVDFPRWIVQELDKEADIIGVPRQSLIKMWLVERLRKD